MRWDGATVVVTGASRGIGRAIALAAAGKGARLGLVARSADALAALRDELGGPATIAAADLTDRHQLEQAWSTLTKELGPVDVLVNNAGVGTWGPFVDSREDDVDAVIALNLVAAMQLTRLALPDMIRRRRGHVVNVGSIAGRVGVPFEATYSASKFGLSGFTEALALEVRTFRIGVSMVNPGPVATEFVAAARWPRYSAARPRPVPPERVASAVIAAVERGDVERVVPRWLRVADVARAVVPRLYAAGAKRAAAPQLAEFRRRWA
jgi:short-subunit dehydrogenase